MGVPLKTKIYRERIPFIIFWKIPLEPFCFGIVLIVPTKSPIIKPTIVPNIEILRVTIVPLINMGPLVAQMLEILFSIY